MISQKLYKFANLIYGIVGSGKKLESTDTVLILGGSNGLGKDICTQLCQNEIKVINVDTQDTSIPLMGKCYTFIPCKSFAETHSVQEAMQAVKSLVQPITILINNVQRDFKSVYQMEEPLSPLDESIDQFKECVAANLTNVMIATKFFLEQLVPQSVCLTGNKSQDYYLVNLSSILTLNVPEQASHYVSSKAALNQFHDSLTSELKSSRHKKVHYKTLLVFLPFSKDYLIWNQSTSCLSQQLIDCLHDGRKGDVLLRIDDSPLTAFKVSASGSCRFSNMVSKWKQ
ncbi:hypothetical protein ZYGR_0A03520 [Zygosaccharomyces rouxii]|uniref:ZYRO0A08030p n=2 Tax=Zygosaccharomyces rouxii TaxID=4956 RepID=C5DQ22_ZYGRC|nr:uncharacterized protein ZYRO0A08030g [Zygosaccharomyces rouxii]KAH9198697.1 hypothetical protein LQ764DRAFT_139983 [Zygosaccharomyces rouxii]GAV46757.1 hypothetical protein ZYGR_0A03520 [Zygosaccharomyces rouxii]CAR25783.1 ZYRO0A08030p [Zygosaccharomyces rouxii]